MSLLGKSMCSSDAGGQSRRGFRQEAREGRVARHRQRGGGGVERGLG